MLPPDPSIAGDVQAEPEGEVCAEFVPVSAPSNPGSPAAFLPQDGKTLPVQPAETSVADRLEFTTGVEPDDAGDDLDPCAGAAPVLPPDPPVVIPEAGQAPAAAHEPPVTAAPVIVAAPITVPAPAAVQTTGETVVEAEGDADAAEPVRIPVPNPAVPAPRSTHAATPAPGPSSSSTNGGAVTAASSPSPMPPAAPGSVSVPTGPEATAPAPASTPDVGARLQELLARLGANDGANPLRGEAVHALLRDPEGGVPANAAALTYAQAGAAAQPRGDVPVPGPALQTPLRHPEWSDELGQRIRWALGNQIQSAELKINPPQLGPLEIRVSVDSDRQMNVTLSSQHALVRESLQDSLPRLRDLMSEQGFGAVNVDVSQHSLSDGGRSSARQPGAESVARAESGPADDAAGPGADRPREIRGLVDLYA
ncbi:MAG: flagellar hook-length control protein FliK [Gammaproteobacteria bacterium]|nr:flagellar hook-length control protein FliK [Gammaproteobacteria bacterium]